MKRMVLAWLGALAAACSESDSNVSDAGTHDTGAEGGAGDATANHSAGVDLFGELAIRLVAPVPASGSSPGSAGYTSISGKLYDSEPALPFAFVDDSSEAGCVLLKPRPPLFCEPSCEESVCHENNLCVPYAKVRGAGTLSVSGLGAEVLSVAPIADTYTTPGSVSLPFPAFAEGAPIRIRSDAVPFTLETHGIAPLALANQNVALSASEPIALQWTAGADSAAARIAVELDISHHGGTKGKITCDVEDTGTLSIGATLVGKLLALGVAGFPTIKVTRYTTSSAQVGAGTISVRVYSDIEREVQIAGLVSCTKTSHCPDGKVCGSDLVCK